MKKDIVIDFNHVTKRYKLYKNEKQRLFGVFSKKIPYSEKLAVDDVTFQVERGETVAFFGRNGAGKSTILKMITGVSYPTKGTIDVEGRVSALLELTSGFDPELTGRENIYLKGQLIGLKDEEIAELEQEIVDFAEVDEYIDQPVRTYSSGMRARLGFAVNVNIHPEILIVDEALSVGDKEFRTKCLEKVNSIIETEGVTLLFVTHSTGTARQFCKRGIFMVQGKLKYDGDIDRAIALYDGVGEAIKQRRAARKAREAAEAEAAKLGTPEAIAVAEAAIERHLAARERVKAINQGDFEVLETVMAEAKATPAVPATKAAPAAKAEPAAEPAASAENAPAPTTTAESGATK